MRRAHLSLALVALSFSLAGADAPPVVDAPHGEARDVPRGEDEYASARRLRDALGVCGARLIRDGREEYVPLLREDRVREAILTGVKSYATRVDREENREPGSKDVFEAVRPVLEGIGKDGTWPERCAFAPSYLLVGSDGAKYEGLYLHLRILAPGARVGEFKMFTLPVVDVSYGRPSR